MNTSPYTPPQSDLELPREHEGEGSIEDAINGRYDFAIGEVLGEAWERIDGYKLPIAIISTVYFVIMMVVMIPLNFVLIDLTASIGSIAMLIPQLVQLLFIPMQAALFIIGIHMATGRPINTAMLFAHYDKLIPIIGLQLAIYLAVILGFIALVIPGIYLGLALLFAMPLMIDKDLSIKDAFETSRKAVTHHWFKFFGVWIAMSIIIVISILPLGIGLFWTIPMALSLSGVLYRRTFGVG